MEADTKNTSRIHLKHRRAANTPRAAALPAIMARILASPITTTGQFDCYSGFVLPSFLPLLQASIYRSTGRQAMEAREALPGDLPGASGLDSDTLDAILVRLVAGNGTAKLLASCACVCKLWWIGCQNDELWHALLVQRIGNSAHEILDAMKTSQRARQAPMLSFRALYIRSVTTRVLLWGHCARSEDEAGDAPRAPAPFKPLSESCEVHRVVRQVSAGGGFSCAVSVNCISKHEYARHRERSGSCASFAFTCA